MESTSTKRPFNAKQNLHGFVTRFNTQVQTAKRPKLAPSDYDVVVQKLNESGPLAPKDADATKENISGICRKWKK